jgi:hypothetical protein
MAEGVRLMGDSVFINGRASVHSGSAGKSIAFPDVCLCPPAPPAGPIPTPLPNTVVARDLTAGATTVLIEGNPAGGNQSFFKKSTGNEVSRPTGGGVMSMAVQGAARWGSFSMNVFFEGQPAVRHMDLLTHNHLVQPGNTPPTTWLSTVDPPAVPPKAEVRQWKAHDWIDFTFLNETGKPLKSLPYEATLPDQKVEGELYAGGRLAFLAIPKGNSTVRLLPEGLKK